MAEIEIREAHENDAAAIARLAEELGYPSTAEQIRQRLASLSADRHAVFVAVDVAEEVVGWIQVSEVRNLISGLRAEINGLIVNSAKRSAGTGRQLLERGERWARQKGLPAIGVQSNIVRERAHAFYLRHGYAVSKTQKAFRKEL
jgi:GNAT superfamily N-acetyltransferase